jgi:hypothetical protein
MHRCLNRNSERGRPAIPSWRLVPHRRHPSRLPFGSRQLAVAHGHSALTGPAGDAEKTT